MQNFESYYKGRLRSIDKEERVRSPWSYADNAQLVTGVTFTNKHASGPVSLQSPCNNISAGIIEVSSLVYFRLNRFTHNFLLFTHR